MLFEYLVSVEVNRTQGKFAGRDEIGEQIKDALEGADPGSYEGENGGEYETAEWSVEEQDTRKTEPAAAFAKPESETGMRYVFVVTSQKADGSDVRTFDLNVTALNKAEAWKVVGLAVEKFMNSPNGRLITSAKLT